MLKLLRRIISYYLHKLTLEASSLYKEGKVKMKSKQKKAISKKSFVPPVINDNTINGILSHPKFFRGHIRTATGRIYKTGEFEERSDRVLGTKLP